MLFSFTTKMSYSKHKHVGRRRLTAYIKRYKEKDVQLIYETSFSSYLPLSSLIDTKTLDTNLPGNSYVFKILKIKWEKQFITVLCETANNKIGKLVEQLFDVGANLHLSLSCPWVSDESKIKNYVFRFKVEVATPHADLSSLCLLMPCGKEEFDNGIDADHVITTGESNG